MELAIKSYLFHELSFLILAGEPQKSHSNFIDINKTYVKETFKKTAPISTLKLHQNQKENKMINQPYEVFLKSYAKLLEELVII